jgi:L-threonylcarbamoyladenylate synthase
MSIHIGRAARVLLSGGLVAYPTEAVWGLGCDPWNSEAVARLLTLKNRSWRKGLILVAANTGQLQPLLDGLTASQKNKLVASWPGPVTWLVPNNNLFPCWVTGDSPKVAVRVSAHPLVRALCEKFEGPVISTSANPAGRPPARSALKVRCYFGNSVDYILPGSLGAQQTPSEIRDSLTDQIFRPA